MKKTIIIVDDEKKPSVNWLISELEDANFYVVHFETTDRFRQFLLGDLPKSGVVAIILDMIMPPGEHYSQFSHEQQTRTGIFVLEDIIRKFSEVPEAWCPIFIYSKIGAEKKLRLEICEMLALYDVIVEVPIWVKDNARYEATQEFCAAVITSIQRASV